LNFFGPGVSFFEEYVLIDTLVVYEAGEIVVHDSAAKPTIEQFRLQQLELLVIPNLIVRHDKRTATLPFVERARDINPITVGLLRDTGQHPEVIIKATLRHFVESPAILQPTVCMHTNIEPQSHIKVPAKQCHL